MCEKIQSYAGRYGWGVVVSAAPYVNWIAMLTAGLAVFLVTLFFSLFGVSPAPPEQSGNPIAWALYLMIMACWGWAMWAYFLGFFLIPLGAAWSLGDLVAARYSGSADRYVGAITGLSLTILPILSYFWYGDQSRQALEPYLLHQPFLPTGNATCGCD